MSFTFRQLLLALGIKKHIEEQYDDNDDPKVNIHTLYKHRWVWYHLILCIQMILTNILLVGILIVLAIKL